MFMEKKVASNLEESIDHFCISQHKLSITNSIVSKIILFVNLLFSIVILCIGANQIFKGFMSIGTLMLVSNIQSRTMMPLNFFSSFFLQYRSSFPSLNRLSGFLELKNEFDALNNKNIKHKENKSNKFNLIQFKDVSYTYNGISLALRKINIEIKYGDKIVIIGNNMSGKTTLLNILAGLIEPDSGEIYIDDKNANMFMLRNVSTVHFQDSEVYKIGDIVGSGGERQIHKVSLMDKIYSPILLFDEPDSNLNKRNMNHIIDLFNKDETIIIVSHRGLEHNLSNIENLRIFEMENGQLMEVNR